MELDRTVITGERQHNLRNVTIENQAALAPKVAFDRGFERPRTIPAQSAQQCSKTTRGLLRGPACIFMIWL